MKVLKICEFPCGPDERTMRHIICPGEGQFNEAAAQQYLCQKLGLCSEREDVGKPDKVIEDLSFDGLIRHWKTHGFKKIITMAGAGISTSAGIPDFRTPKSGPHVTLAKYNLPYPTAIFELSYLKCTPSYFFDFAKYFYSEKVKPTPCHYFIRLLHEKGLLLRHYTQNIDGLERIAGIPEEKLVEAHGTFFSSHCLNCKKFFSVEWMKEKVFSDIVPKCDVCQNLVKPDIVFYEEKLPARFSNLMKQDSKECDLLIILGTSLEIVPFAKLIAEVNERCVRLLINREKVGHRDDPIHLYPGGGLVYDSPDNERDVAWIGNCDDGVYEIVGPLGLTLELNKLIARERFKALEQVPEKPKPEINECSEEMKVEV